MSTLNDLHGYVSNEIADNNCFGSVGSKVQRLLNGGLSSS
jgi:hypothetical protein